MKKSVHLWRRWIHRLSLGKETQARKGCSRRVDIKPHEWSPDAADEFMLLNTCIKDNCRQALTVDGGKFDEVYQLAADMGGMGFIHWAETGIMHNSVLINIYMTEPRRADGRAALLLSRRQCACTAIRNTANPK